MSLTQDPVERFTAKAVNGTFSNLRSWSFVHYATLTESADSKDAASTVRFRRAGRVIDVRLSHVGLGVFLVVADCVNTSRSTPGSCDGIGDAIDFDEYLQAYHQRDLVRSLPGMGKYALFSAFSNESPMRYFRFAQVQLEQIVDILGNRFVRFGRPLIEGDLATLRSVLPILQRQAPCRSELQIIAPRCNSTSCVEVINTIGPASTGTPATQRKSMVVAGQGDEWPSRLRHRPPGRTPSTQSALRGQQGASREGCLELPLAAVQSALPASTSQLCSTPSPRLRMMAALGPRARRASEGASNR